ncbi:MAG: GFA family protein [Gammaproteobacteria bacterium]|nr:GFA family protein [Gammaproteobacteria bacterium]
MTNQKAGRGGCLCGAVTVFVETPSNSVAACHCNMCRKWTSGPLFAIQCDSGVYFDGEKDTSVFNSSEWAERGFCSHCGSHLFYRLKETNQYFIPAGLFDDVSTFVFEHQIFIEEKPVFYDFANKTENMTGAEIFSQYSPESE